MSSVTFLAAATSIPDAVSSMAVARKGDYSQKPLWSDMLNKQCPEQLLLPSACKVCSKFSMCHPILGGFTSSCNFFNTRSLKDKLIWRLAHRSVPTSLIFWCLGGKSECYRCYVHVTTSCRRSRLTAQVGLPIPWLIKCGIEANNPDFEGITIRSPYLMFYTCLLLGMVFGTVCSIKFSGWKLQKTLGACMAVLYFIFIVTTVAVELSQPTWLMTNPPT